MADMENFKKFWESVVGRPYRAAGQEQTEKKAKTATNRREGVEPRAKEICTEKV